VKAKLAIMLIAIVTSVFFTRAVGAQSRAAQQWEPLELAFTSARDYVNPYTDVSLFVDFTGPDHTIIHRPAFWDGNKTWRVRFAPPAMGRWEWRSTCSDATDTGLHGKEGYLNTTPYSGSNPLVRHGLLRMSKGHRYNLIP